ncbi:MAG: prohibitin family protein [Bacteroidota bacterium]
MKVKPLWVASGLIGFLILYTFLASFYTITSGTVGVLVTFGEYNEEVRLPGLHLKIPYVQTVKIFDVKLQTVNYVAEQDVISGDGEFNKAQIKVLDSKNLPIGIDLSIQFTPIAEDADKILENYGRNYFDKLLNPVIRSVVRNVIGKYQAEDIAVKRTEIAVEIRNEMLKTFEGLPFSLNEIAMRNIILPAIVQKKIEEVQLAKQEEQRLAMVEQQAKKNQHIKTIEANTRLIEVTTQAKAEAEKKRIAAEAEAYQIEVEAKARAAANKLIAESVTKNLIEYRSIDKWSGNYPQTLMGGKDGVILPLPRTR